MTVAAMGSRGRHRRGQLVLPDAPSDAEKALYAWRSLPFLTSALAFSSVCLITAQVWFEIRNPIALPFLLYTGLFTVYQAVSLPVNFAGRSFDAACAG